MMNTNTHNFITRMRNLSQQEKQAVLNRRQEMARQIPPSSKRFGHFHLSPLGSGGMAKVYASKDTDGINEFPIAIKVLNQPEGSAISRDFVVRSFRLEAKAMAEIDHPNVVRAYPADVINNELILKHDGYLAYAMERVDGPDMHRLIKEPLQFPIAANIIVQVCDGLSAIHAAGYVHRDIKPHNIIITNPDQLTVNTADKISIKICDFGLARRINSNNPNEDIPLPEGIVCGTPAYLAKKIFMREDFGGIDTDTYSVFMTLLAAINPEFFRLMKGEGGEKELQNWYNFHFNNIMRKCAIPENLPDAVKGYLLWAMFDERKLQTPQIFKEGLLKAMTEQLVVDCTDAAAKSLEQLESDGRLVVPQERTPNQEEARLFSPANLLLENMSMGLVFEDVDSGITFSSYKPAIDLLNPDNSFHLLDSVISHFNAFSSLIEGSSLKSRLPSYRKLKVLFDRDPAKRERFAANLIEQNQEMVVFPVSEYVASDVNTLDPFPTFEQKAKNVKITLVSQTQQEQLFFSFDYSGTPEEEVFIPPESLINIDLKETKFSFGYDGKYIGHAFAYLTNDGKFGLCVPPKTGKSYKVVLQRPKQDGDEKRFSKKAVADVPENLDQEDSGVVIRLVFDVEEDTIVDGIQVGDSVTLQNTDFLGMKNGIANERLPTIFDLNLDGPDTYSKRPDSA